jgi:predicted ATPase
MPDRPLPPPYLSELRLKNFKSVRDQRIPLSALTLVIGSNSSGKSNLVRALLALTQTIESRSPTVGFLLNGSRINLGLFSDVARQGCEEEPVSVGVTVVSDFGRLAAGPYYFYSAEDELPQGNYELLFDCSFSGTDEADPIYSPATAIGLDINSADPANATKLRLTFSSHLSPRLSRTEVLWRDWYSQPSARVVKSIQGSWRRGTGKSIRLAAADIRGLMPQSVFERRDGSRAFAELWMDALDEVRAVGLSRTRRGSPQTTSEDSVVSLACNVITEWRDGDRDIPFIHYIFTRLSEASIKRSALAALDRSTTEDRITAELSKGGKEYVSLAGTDSHRLRQAAATLATDFQNRIHYLGGLRAAPMPVYQPSPQVQAGQIGDQGQFAASALHTLREQVVAMPLDQTGTIERRPLREAVKHWAMQLELFEDVTPHHRGSLGLDIQVVQPGLAEPVDITSVGLGVSQLLPVIVRCLLSDPGEVVILEQPELHLHPAAQQKLADFLLACALSGRQLLVETHSEHLINRIRLRCAQDDSTDAETSSKVGIIFAERHRDSGETEYKASALNRFGGLDSWPAGFLESGLTDAQQLLEVGLAKKRRETAG